MSLNETASAERLHIAFFGLRNVGKSSLVNAVTGQPLAVVSEVKGTTTDPVKKAMELLLLGAVVIIDTAGLDDTGDLGELRVQKTREVLAKTDLAVLVTDATRPLESAEQEWIDRLEARKIPYLIAYNKSDLLSQPPQNRDHSVYVSAKTGAGVYELKEHLAHLKAQLPENRKILADLVQAGDTVILVTPIDESAPKGRIILPQQQVLRELLDCHCRVSVCQPQELSDLLQTLMVKPALVITDSQVFGKVNALLPTEIPLTSFSILFARYKGNLETLVQGAAALENLKDGDRVLIAEGCTHHRQCNDIGTVKMPGWIREFSGAAPDFSFTSGGAFPEDLSGYRLIIHCGGCMLNAREMQSHLETARQAGVPMVNYGVAIAQMHGILKRSLQPFSDMIQY